MVYYAHRGRRAVLAPSPQCPDAHSALTLEPTAVENYAAPTLTQILTNCGTSCSAPPLPILIFYILIPKLAGDSSSYTRVSF
jgi:hypothetical protein